tara:strand:+ start:61 stop:585 length:525 start_codon:yes stop_codon:yes gene_type:complete
MIGADLKSITKNFLDTKHVRRQIDRARVKALTKQGAFVRRAARSSIRAARMKKPGEMTPEERRSYEWEVSNAKRRGLKKPKRPKASSRPGEPPRSQVGTLRRFLFFSYDRHSQSVVVGPARVPAKDQDAPQNLEFGGTVDVGGRRARIQPRPYMGPALAQEQPNFAALWRNSIR